MFYVCGMEKTLKGLIEEKGVTAYSLAVKMKLSPQYMYDIVSGRKSCSLERYVEICLNIGYTEAETLQFVADKLGFQLIIIRERS